MGEVYGIDMEVEGRRSKLVRDIPDPDIAISMGCNVGCPFIGRPFDDDWGYIYSEEDVELFLLARDGAIVRASASSGCAPSTSSGAAGEAVARTRDMSPRRQTTWSARVSTSMPTAS